MKEKNKIVITLIFLTVIVFITYVNLMLSHNDKGKMQTTFMTNNSTMLIMYNDMNDRTNYVIIDLITMEEKEILEVDFFGFPNSYLSHDKQFLYFTYTTYITEWESHLIRTNININDNYDWVYFDTPGLYVNDIEIHNDKIFMKVVQLDNPYRRNFNIAVYDINTKEINLWNKEEFDLSIWKFDYNPYTQKLYGVERSESGIRKAQPPKLPTYRIVEFDKDGNRLEELLEIKMSIDSISVSKDGKYGIFSGSTHSYNDIFIINFEDGTIKRILEGNSTNLVKWPIFSPDEKGFYYLAITSDSKILKDDTGQYMTRGVYYYDFETKEAKLIFMKDDGIVLNFEVIE